MRLTVAVLWAVAGTAWALENSENVLYDEHFPPLHPNCTQSLTDLLLLRQEIQLKELKQAEQVSAGILREMADILTDIKGSLTRNTSTGVSCPGNFINFGETCLYLAKDVGLTWEAALVFCQDLGGNLAVFRDANAFADALGYVKASGIAKTGNVWVGGNDHSVEGEWRWVTGEDMPRGTPFWGDYNYVREPAQGTAANCALLHGPDDFLIHDGPCDWKVIPLCEISASRTG
ncbi:C-type lectin domain family 10 member A-like [Penaeus monodon]|uniref:C-type lectin domain family 10 member A-like n=1 Tax=Penaeus monodon TaxID=6687 RepID=UPI0018A7C1D5|nr:C-type lectin domain family 10 member A-like [Penaeus monodon]XP_037799152.1 C-type lectin domain family 10 member A-like [Penaeus monodon]